MSSFGVQAPIWRSIVTENVFFNDAEQVKIHLEQKHVDKANWFYKTVSIDELERIRIDRKKAFQIKGCEKIHITALLLQSLHYWKFQFLQNREMESYE